MSQKLYTPGENVSGNQAEIITPAEQQKLLRKLYRARKKILSLKNVKDVAIGFKFKNGKITNEPALIVYVHEKLKREKLKAEEMIPEIVFNIQTDIIQSQSSLERSPALTGFIEGGIKVSNPSVGGWGTMGTVFNESGSVYGFSNFHVLGVRFLRSRKGDPVIGFRDGVQQQIGVITELNRKLDLAIFRINDPTLLTGKSMHGVALNLQGTTEPLLGMQVLKSGSATGVTFGKIIALNGNTFKVGPVNDADKSEISREGDSGSVWATNAQPFLAVGLHFFGDRDGDNADEFASAIPFKVIEKSRKKTFHF